MKTIRVTTLSLLLIFAICNTGFPQEYSLGGSLIYNAGTAGTGLGLRAEFPVHRLNLFEGLYLSPQAAYFPGFNNDYNEFYLGAAVNVHAYRLKKWIFYGLLSMSYRGWINYEDSGDENAGFSRMATDIGVGVTRRTCIRPFAEFRLNVVGAEPNLRLGLLYTFNCDIRGAVPCSRIPPQPAF